MIIICERRIMCIESNECIGRSKDNTLCVEGSSIQVTSYLCHHCFTRGWRIVIGVDSTVHVYDHLRTCLYVCKPN